ncbi:DMT family transporter [Alicyclobacillus tolerans]|uniref:DMT family transporter n=1 Tax=Alicyclobacillus tolerans TaxID=90970 RepID=UPI003B7D08BB
MQIESEATQTLIDVEPQKSQTWIGTSAVLTAAIFWGLSGTAAQVLFQTYHESPFTLAVIRMLGSGIVLLIMTAFQKGMRFVFLPFFQRNTTVSLLIFAIVGMLGVQFSYLSSIRYGNAPTATFLQYLCPAMVSAYLWIRGSNKMNKIQWAAVGLALLGTYFLVRNGHPYAFAVPLDCIVWGVISALTLAFYTIYPVQLLHRFGSLLVTGWSMLLGGLCLLIILPFLSLSIRVVWRPLPLMLLGFVVFAGTLLAFWLYIFSLTHLQPQVASVLASAEPLSSALAGVFFLQLHFAFTGWLGAFCILTAVFILQVYPFRKNRKRKVNF